MAVLISLVARDRCPLGCPGPSASAWALPYPEYLRATYGTRTLSGWLTVLQYYLLRILNIPLLSTFEAVCLHRYVPLTRSCVEDKPSATGMSTASRLRLGIFGRFRFSPLLGRNCSLLDHQSGTDIMGVQAGINLQPK